MRTAPRTERHAFHARRARRYAFPLAGAVGTIVAGVAAPFVTSGGSVTAAADSCEGSGIGSSVVCWDHVHTLPSTDPLAAGQGAPWATPTGSIHEHTLTAAEDTGGTQGAPYATVTSTNHWHGTPADGAPGYWQATNVWVPADHWHAAIHSHTSTHDHPFTHDHQTWHDHPFTHDHPFNHVHNDGPPVGGKHVNTWSRCSASKNGACTSWEYLPSSCDIVNGQAPGCGHTPPAGYAFDSHTDVYTKTSYDHNHTCSIDAAACHTHTCAIDAAACHLHTCANTATQCHNHTCAIDTAACHAHDCSNDATLCHNHSSPADGWPGSNHSHALPADGAPGYWSAVDTWVGANHEHTSRSSAPHSHITWTYPVHVHIISAGDDCTLDAASGGVCPS